MPNAQHRTTQGDLALRTSEVGTVRLIPKATSKPPIKNERERPKGTLAKQRSALGKNARMGVSNHASPDETASEPVASVDSAKARARRTKVRQAGLGALAAPSQARAASLRLIRKKPVRRTGFNSKWWTVGDSRGFAAQPLKVKHSGQNPKNMPLAYSLNGFSPHRFESPNKLRPRQK